MAGSTLERAEAGWREIQTRWPDGESALDQQARRLELILLLHQVRDLASSLGEADGDTEAPGVRRVGEWLDGIEAEHCDRRDPEQAASALRLPPDRVQDLARHLQRHQDARQRGEDAGDIDLFRGIEVCRYR